MTDMETKIASSEAQAAVQPADVAADEAAFGRVAEALFGSEGPAEASGDSGGETDTEEASEATEGKEAAPKAADPEPEDAPAASEDGERLGIRALTDEQVVALRRAKVPQEVLDGLDDAGLLALADRLMDMRAEQDRAFDAMRSQEDPVEEASAKDEGEEEPPARLPGSDPKPVDFKRAADPLAEVLGLDADEGDAVAAAFQQIYESAVTATTEALKPVIDAAKQQADQAMAGFGSVLADAARNELSAQWPQLADPERWGEVQAKALKLAPAYGDEPDMRKSMRDLLTDASWRVLGPPQDGNGRASVSGKVKGQPSKPGGKRRSASPKTDGERDAALFDQAVKRAGLDLS